MSKGHGPAALYAILAAKGFFPADWLDGSSSTTDTSARIPTARRCPGIEASTGSLGHGLAMAVGDRVGAARQGARRSRASFVLCGDAELNEGSNWESILLAPQRAARQPDPARDRQPQLGA